LLVIHTADAQFNRSTTGWPEMRWDGIVLPNLLLPSGRIDVDGVGISTWIESSAGTTARRRPSDANGDVVVASIPRRDILPIQLEGVTGPAPFLTWPRRAVADPNPRRRRRVCLRLLRLAGARAAPVTVLVAHLDVDGVVLLPVTTHVGAAGAAGDVVPAAAVDAVAAGVQCRAVVARADVPGEVHPLTISGGRDVHRVGSRRPIGAERVRLRRPVPAVAVAGAHLHPVAHPVVGHGDLTVRGQGAHRAPVDDPVLVPGDRLAVVLRRAMSQRRRVVLTGRLDPDVPHPTGLTERAHLLGPRRHLRVPRAVDRHQAELVVVRVLHLHLPGRLPAPGGEGLHPVAVLVHPQLVGGDRIAVVVRGTPLDHQAAAVRIVDTGGLWRCWLGGWTGRV